MVKIDEMAEPQKLKEQGNKHFSAGEYEEAITFYTKAIQIPDEKDKEQGVYLKNRSACYLKLGKNEQAAEDATQALELLPNDPKALFRRCQAYQNLGKLEEAFTDARQLLHIEPKNKAIQPVLQKLSAALQDKAKEMASTDSKVNQMFDLGFKNIANDKEKQIQAINNLIVLAREESGANKLYKDGAIPNLNKILDDRSNPELLIAATRVLACLANDNRERAEAVLDIVGTAKMCFLMGQEHKELSKAMAHLIGTVVRAIAGVEKFLKVREEHAEKRKQEGPQGLGPTPLFQMDEETGQKCVGIFMGIIKMINSGKVSACGRDSALELIIKNVPSKEGLDCCKQFLETDGVARILEVAGSIPALEYHRIKTTENTRMHCSVALSRIYDDLMGDKQREKFREQCKNYISEQLGDKNFESKLEAVMAISTLLQGPYEVGNGILGTEGVLEIMLALANSTEPLHQKIAVEALVHSASKKDKCSGIIKQAVPILKQLYHSQNDYIKVRALVGLCKLGSFGGTDASMKSFAEGSTLTLAKACRKFMSNPTKDVDLRKWACEGLAYLTLDADVKEELVNDTEAVKSLIDLAQVGDKSILYPAATVFVNLTNSYDKQEIMPELLELAKYSKQHVPEEDPKDKEEYVKKRVDKLVKAGIASALVAFHKTESESSKELLARVFNAICTEPEHRGLVVQQGGAKALIPLSLEGNDVGKTMAAWALAKIAITTNPEIAFPGQRVLEVVRPLLHLLHIEHTSLQNFEALMALTNLTSVSESVRKRIVKEKGFSNIEHYLFEEHEMLRRAAAECMCNLVLSEEVLKMFEGENDRVKILVLYSGEEEFELARASSGALAILSEHKFVCDKILQVKSWVEILGGLAAQDKIELKHRAVFIINNLCNSDKDICQKVVESQLLEVLMALSELKGEPLKKIKDLANDALKKAQEFGFIKAAS